MPAARPVALALTPENRVVAKVGGVDAAEDFLEQRREKGVRVVGRPDDERAVRLKDVECLLDHVDLQLALAAASRQVQHGLEVGGQIPQVRRRHYTGRDLCAVISAAERSAWCKSIW